MKAKPYAPIAMFWQFSIGKGNDTILKNFTAITIKKNAHVALALAKKFFTIWNLNTPVSQQVIYLLICELLDYYWWQLLEESLN